MLQNDEQFNPLAGMDLSSVQGMPQQQVAIATAQPVTVQFNSMAELEELLILKLERSQGLHRGKQGRSETMLEGFFDMLKWGIPTISVAGVLMMAIATANRPNANLQAAMQQQTAIALVAAKQKPANVTCIMFFGECPKVPMPDQSVPVVQPVQQQFQEAQYQQPVQRWETHQARQNINFRQDPGGAVRVVLPQGAPLQYQNETRNLKGATWAKVKIQDGRAGWVDVNFLASL